MFLPDYYEFCARVKTVAGHRALDRIPEMLTTLGASRPMIVTDKGVAGAGLIKLVNGAMKGSKAKVGALYDEVPPDSEYTIVNAAAKLYRAKKCDSIIAVERFGARHGQGDQYTGIPRRIEHPRLRGAGAVKRKLKPMIAIRHPARGRGHLVAVIADHKEGEDGVHIVFSASGHSASRFV